MLSARTYPFDPGRGHRQGPGDRDGGQHSVGSRASAIRTRTWSPSNPSFLQYGRRSPRWSGWGPARAGAEGPVWFGDGSCLLFSDIPTIVSCGGTRKPARVTAFRPSIATSQRQYPRSAGAANHVRARERRVGDATESTAAVTVLVDRYDGKRPTQPTTWWSTPMGRSGYRSRLRHPVKLRGPPRHVRGDARSILPRPRPPAR